MHRPTLGSMLCALLAGCTVGPDYVKPQVDAPEQYRFQDAAARDTANTEWWKQFDDPVLDALIAEALAHNYNVQIAAAHVEEAAAVLTQTRSQFFPQLGYSGSAARQRASESSFGPLAERVITNPTNAYDVLASASWEIDLWGRIRRQTEAARANVLATEQARRGVILSLVSQVASAYLQLRGLDSQLEIANKTLAAYGQTLKLFELRFKYGQLSQMEVEQARSRYETAATQIPQIETGIAQTENALSILLGRNPGGIVRGKSIQVLAMPAVPAGMPSDLLARRPDIAQSEQSLIAANAQIGAAKALYFPSISLTGAFGTSSTELSDLFKGPSRVWSFGGSLTGPIFTGGAIKGQVAQTEAAREAALLSYEGSIQSAFADVDDALVAHRQIVIQLAAQERLVKALSEYERLAQLQYDGGYTPYSTVLQAQQELFPQQLNLAQNRYAVYNALVNLYKATGGGWIDIAQRQADEPVQTSAGKAPGATETSPPPASRPLDRIEVRMNGDTSVVDVFRVAGIGGAQVKPPRSGWPPAVIVRLHGFPELESFKAQAGTDTLDCALNRVEGRPPLHRCRLGGAEVQALSRTAGYFQVDLPPALLAADGNAVELHWVDQWR
jgi:outer membrane protein, multidrug efflux system